MESLLFWGTVIFILNTFVPICTLCCWSTIKQITFDDMNLEELEEGVHDYDS
jgi:hypothetical protein